MIVDNIMLNLSIIIVVISTTLGYKFEWNQNKLMLKYEAERFPLISQISLIIKGTIVKEQKLNVQFLQNDKIRIQKQYQTSKQHQYLLFVEGQLFPVDLFYQQQSYLINSLYRNELNNLVQEVLGSKYFINNTNPSRFSLKDRVVLQFIWQLFGKNISIIQGKKFNYDGQTLTLGRGFLRITKDFVSYYEDGYSYKISSQQCIQIGYFSDIAIVDGFCANFIGYQSGFILKNRYQNQNIENILFLGSSFINIKNLKILNEEMEQKGLNKIILLQQQKKTVRFIDILTIVLYTRKYLIIIFTDPQNQLKIYYSSKTQLYNHINSIYFKLIFINSFFDLNPQTYNLEQIQFISQFQYNSKPIIFVQIGNQLEFKNNLQKTNFTNYIQINTSYFQTQWFFFKTSFILDHYQIQFYNPQINKRQKKATLLKKQSFIIRKIMKLLLSPQTDFQIYISKLIILQWFVIIFLSYKIRKQHKNKVGYKNVQYDKSEQI